VFFMKKFCSTNETTLNKMKIVKSSFVFLIYIFVLGFYSNAQVFTTNGSQIISPEGNPIKLSGFRIASGSWGKNRDVSLEDFTKWKDLGLMGNAQAVEIWFSGGVLGYNPSEPYPHRPGYYIEEAMPLLLNALRNIARSGSYIIPSIRVGYDGAKAIEYTKNGTTGWEGWALHNRVLNNDPVVVETGPNAGTYGNHRDRFFAWLDYLIPAILADKEIADKIAYWETWHFAGHKQSINTTKYLDDFMPLLLAKYREHIPEGLLGVSAHTSMGNIITRLNNGTWQPYNDPNWILVLGGYGTHSMFFSDRFLSLVWPKDSGKPTWLGTEFDVEKYVRMTGRAMHSQEGPGTREYYRTTPIRESQRTWMIGLFNLYNRTTNGFGFHDWPPTYVGRNNIVYPDNFDETELFQFMREALAGNQIGGTTNITKPIQTGNHKIYSYNEQLTIEGLQIGETIEVYSLTGSLMFKANADLNVFNRDMPRGLYLVKVGDARQKVFVY
jgi:hypothetical protein